MKYSGLVAALALAAALLGCQDEPEPKFTDPTETPTSETSETSSPIDESKGPRAEERELVTEFIRGIREAMETGEPSSFLDLASDDCRNCRIFARNIRRAFKNGGHIEGGDWRVVKARHSKSVRHASRWLVDVKSTKELWLDRDGNVVNSAEAGLQLFVMDVSRSGNELLLDDIAFRDRR